ncbi:hypothetical protein Mrose_02286 [Calidithermus roseus]|uniref:Uncharacterized protein n=1 Tax=Calidithermus roseus TaxID=1644118 RepID=A0A399EP02_9DEIN|nr:hypothetical protein Mrose_02286 [Calidithermus roseus]
MGPGGGLQAREPLALLQLQHGPLGIGQQDLAPQGLLTLGQRGVVHGHQDAQHPPAHPLQGNAQVGLGPHLGGQAVLGEECGDPLAILAEPPGEDVGAGGALEGVLEGLATVNRHRQGPVGGEEPVEESPAHPQALPQRPHQGLEVTGGHPGQALQRRAHPALGQGQAVALEGPREHSPQALGQGHLEGGKGLAPAPRLGVGHPEGPHGHPQDALHRVGPQSRGLHGARREGRPRGVLHHQRGPAGPNPASPAFLPRIEAGLIEGLDLAPHPTRPQEPPGLLSLGVGPDRRAPAAHRLGQEPGEALSQRLGVVLLRHQQSSLQQQAGLQVVAGALEGGGPGLGQRLHPAGFLGGVGRSAPGRNQHPQRFPVRAREASDDLTPAGAGAASGRSVNPWIAGHIGHYLGPLPQGHPGNTPVGR